MTNELIVIGGPFFIPFVTYDVSYFLYQSSYRSSVRELICVMRLRSSVVDGAIYVMPVTVTTCINIPAKFLENLVLSCTFGEITTSVTNERTNEPTNQRTKYSITRALNSSRRR